MLWWNIIIKSNFAVFKLIFAWIEWFQFDKNLIISKLLQKDRQWIEFKNNQTFFMLDFFFNFLIFSNKI